MVLSSVSDSYSDCVWCSGFVIPLYFCICLVPIYFYVIVASLCGVYVCVRVCVSNFSSKTTRPGDMLFVLKDSLKIPSMKNCSRLADQFVRLFARAIISEVPPTLSMKILTLYHNFLSDYCRDFPNVLHICTRSQVDSLVLVSDLDLS